MTNCFFSLITGTIGRKAELIQLMESLKVQTYQDFELILVDQNQAGYIDDIVKKYAADFTIIHLHSAKGLSKARNLALKHCHGKWCAFPDDDCHYPQDLLANIFNYISNNPTWHGISTMVTDTNGKFSAGGYMAAKNQPITNSNVWRCAVSPSLFLNIETVNAANGFNEQLGVGADSPWGAGEETDLILKILENDCHIEYIADLKVFHPRFSDPWNKEAIKRSFAYGCGMGYVLKKHNYQLKTVFWYASLQLIKGLIYLPTFNLGKVFSHWSMAYGRLYGFFATGNITGSAGTNKNKKR
jgi:glycosyltransferase involved in cell wall biosynthesis